MGRIGLTTPEETQALGQAWASKLRPNTILALQGDLGAGKTTFVQGLAKGLKVEESVQSPTFVLLQVYDGTIPLYHFDLYRLKEASEFLQMGFDEYFHKGGVCAIEWPERIASLLPKETLFIHLSYKEGNQRFAEVPC